MIQLIRCFLRTALFIPLSTFSKKPIEKDGHSDGGGSVLVFGGARTLCELDDMLSGVFDKIWPLVGILLLMTFIYGGVMWMMSAGDSQKVSKATGTFLWAFIGTAILVLVMVIMGTFEKIFGLPENTFRAFDIGC